MIIRHEVIDRILPLWESRIGDDYAGYHGHVYRVFNFCLALRPCTQEEQHKLAIAACFHDTGLWSDHTTDYIPPSIKQACLYLSTQGFDRWANEISLIIDQHHKIRHTEDMPSPLIELFRKADLVDFSLGTVRFGLPRAFIHEVKTTFPNQGFHRFLLKSAGDWFLHHPFSPPPFIKW